MTFTHTPLDFKRWAAFGLISGVNARMADARRWKQVKALYRAYYASKAPWWRRWL